MDFVKRVMAVLLILQMIILGGCSSGAGNNQGGNPESPAPSSASDPGNKVGSSGDQLAEARELAASMSDEELCAQMIVVGFASSEPDYYVNKMIEQRHIGGVILYTRNIKDAQQVAALIKDLQDRSMKSSQLPLLVTTDVEGGDVNRFRNIIVDYPTPNQQGGMEAADVQAISRIVGAELRAMGVNVNLAPVSDVAGPETVMAKRVFGDDPAKVAVCVGAAVTGYQESGIAACSKHFPGLGDSGMDTHQQTVNISEDRATIESQYLPSFMSAMDAEVEMVMATHATYTSLDEGNPASVSKAIQTDLLRQKLGYKGIIISDDLEMGAAKAAGRIGPFAVEAVKAGTDLLLVCHTPDLQVEVYDALVKAVKSGDISRQRLEESVAKIIALKWKYKMADNINIDPSAVADQVNTAGHREEIASIRAKYGLGQKRQD